MVSLYFYDKKIKLPECTRLGNFNYKIFASRNARNKALTLPFISAIVIQVTKKKAASSPAALEQTGQSFCKAAGQLCAFVMEDDRKGPVLFSFCILIRFCLEVLTNQQHGTSNQ